MNVARLNFSHGDFSSHKKVIEKLRENEGTKDIPIIIMTSKDLSNEELSYLRHQTEEVVKKGSFSREDLLSTIKKLRKTAVL